MQSTNYRGLRDSPIVRFGTFWDSLAICPEGPRKFSGRVPAFFVKTEIALSDNKSRILAANLILPPRRKLCAPPKAGNAIEKPIHVVLADDHALVRAGIRALLERIDRVEVIGEAGDGLAALELIEKLVPDIVLLDLTMPGLSGFELLKETSEKFPQVSMIVLSVHDSEEYATHALRSGAVGYLPKSAASTELEAAIQKVASGGKYLSPSIAREASLESGRGGSEAMTDLTPRQIEVLTLISAGSSTKDIARTLNISVKTVESHRSQLMERLHIHDVAGLTRYAIKKGLVNIDK